MKPDYYSDRMCLLASKKEAKERNENREQSKINRLCHASEGNVVVHPNSSLSAKNALAINSFEVPSFMCV